MVRFTVLASGSKGNSTVISGGRTRILVDAGLSCRELFRSMKLAGEDHTTLDAIVITHEHQDHVNGLAVTARKLGIPVYFTEATHRAWAAVAHSTPPDDLCPMDRALPQAGCRAPGRACNSWPRNSQMASAILKRPIPTIRSIRFLLRHRSWPLSRFPVSRRLLRRNPPGSPQSNIS